MHLYGQVTRGDIHSGMAPFFIDLSFDIFSSVVLFPAHMSDSGIFPRAAESTSPTPSTSRKSHSPSPDVSSQASPSSSYSFSRIPRNDSQQKRPREVSPRSHFGNHSSPSSADKKSKKSMLIGAGVCHQGRLPLLLSFMSMNKCAFALTKTTTSFQCYISHATF